MAVENVELPHVSLNLKALRRLYGETPALFFYVQLTGTTLDETALNGMSSRASQALPGGTSVLVHHWLPVPGGWHGLQGSKSSQDWPKRQHWFELFASELSNQLGGDQHAMITAGPFGRPRLDSDDWELTVNVAYTPLDPLRPDAYRYWLPSHEATERLCAAVEEWTAMPAEWQPKKFLYSLRRKNLAVGAAVVAPLLARSLENHASGILSNEGTPTKGQTVQYSARIVPTNSGLFRVLRKEPGTETWREVLGKLTDALTLDPSITDYGYVRYANNGGSQWWQNCTRAQYWFMADRSSRKMTPQQWMGLSQHDITSHLHLLAEYVPDVNGIQLVTSAHLARAHDLSRWDITDLGHDRHLVQARDLEPWFTVTDTDPAVVAQAQEDFGDMLLTLEVVADAETNPNEEIDIRRRLHLIDHPEEWHTMNNFEKRVYFIDR